MSSANGPRYAPEDPTLPKPWRGLIDGKTGYLYFWNPETNVTQYERPVAKSSSGLPPPARSSSASGNASAHAHRSSSEHGHRHDSRDDGRYNGSRNHHDQGSRGISSLSQSLPNGSAATGYGASHASDHVYNSQSAKPSSKHVTANAGGGLSVESYRRQHEITVMHNGSTGMTNFSHSPVNSLTLSPPHSTLKQLLTGWLGNGGKGVCLSIPQAVFHATGYCTLFVPCPRSVFFLVNQLLGRKQTSASTSGVWLDMPLVFHIVCILSVLCRLAPPCSNKASVKR